jgi:hypothetical protein
MHTKLTPLNKAFRNPSGFDSINNYMGETNFDGLHVVMGRNRDSDLLTESNWEAAKERIADYEVIRFGHWACGWIEYLCVNQYNENAMLEGEKIVEEIDSYPILDEEDFSRREDEEATRVWNDCYSLSERVKLCQEYGESVFAARHEYPPYGGALYDCMRSA